MIPYIAHYPKGAQIFFFLVFIQILIGIGVFVLYYSSASKSKREAERKVELQPVKTEIDYRLEGIINILESHSDTMNNKHALRLEHLLSGWHIKGDKQFEGQSTVVLLKRLINNIPTMTFLSEIIQNLEQMSKILDDRTGEREAEDKQIMDYVALASICERIRATLVRIQHSLN